MVKWTNLRVLVVLAAVAAASVVGVATAAPQDDARSEHQRIVEFWTHARVAQAIPRDFVLDANGALVPRAKPGGTPGNGGGGGGGGDTTDPAGVVTGASWTAGGDVAATTGKVLFALGSSYYVCSASVVVDGIEGTGDSLIATAAHCAYDESNNVFATNWVFIPDYDSKPEPLSTNQAAYCPDTQYGCWTASALTVHSGFASESVFSLAAARYDFAFATVYGGGFNGTTLLDGTVGAQGIEFGPSRVGIDASAFGYPAAKKYKGSDLVYCAGQVVDSGDSTYRLLCDMTGGSSGGPWLTDFDGSGGVLSSVNSYGYRGGDSMYGPIFNGNTAAVYGLADGAAAGPGGSINGQIVQ